MVVLKHVPEWRWMLDREDSPWYPTARLFRQRRPGDWDECSNEFEPSSRTSFHNERRCGQSCEARFTVEHR